MGLTLPGAGCPSGMIWFGMSMACSVVPAVRPACRASFISRSLIRSCLLVWRLCGTPHADRMGQKCACIVCPPGGFCRIFVPCPGQGSQAFGMALVERQGLAGRSPTCRASSGATLHGHGSCLAVRDCLQAGFWTIGVEGRRPVNCRDVLSQIFGVSQ